MELLRRDELVKDKLPGRTIENAVGKGGKYPVQSKKMTICYAHYSKESGPMEPHNHAEESVVVLSGEKCYVKCGPSKYNLDQKYELKPGDIMHFAELEWHVFGYEENGYLDALCIYGQVDHIRPEDITGQAEE